MYLFSGLRDASKFLQETPPLVVVASLLIVGLVWVSIKWQNDVKALRGDLAQRDNLLEQRDKMITRQDEDYEKLRQDYTALVSTTQNNISGVNQQFFSLVQAFAKITPAEMPIIENREPEEVVKALVGDAEEPHAGGDDR